MASNTNNRSIFTQLFKRRVPQILAIYGASCWTVVQIVEWIIGRYLISPHLTDLCLIGMLSFIPSIALMAYFHGTPGRDKWHPIEKIGIPLNIFASILILFIAFYPKDLGAITETIIVEDELGHKVAKVIPKVEYRKKICIFNFRNLSKDETIEWVKKGLTIGIRIDQADELITDIISGDYHYLSSENGYTINDELPLNLMLDIATQMKTKYLLYGDYTIDDSIYIVKTYLYDSKFSQLINERSYRNINLFTIIDEISKDLKIDVEIPEHYIEISKDLPFQEICTSSISAFREYNQGKYERDADNYIKADEHYKKAIAYDDKFAFAYRGLLFNGYKLNKEQDELEHYSNMVLTTMHNIPKYYQRDAKIFHAREFDKDIEKVIMTLEMNKKLHPDDLDIRMELSYIYMRSLEYTKAINQVKYCYSIDPDAKYLRQLIYNYNSIREYDKALELIDDYIAKYPDDDLGFLYAFNAYEIKGDYNKAKEYLLKGLIVDPAYLYGECQIDYYSYILNEINHEKIIEKYYNKIKRSQSDENKATVYLWLANYFSVHGLIDSTIKNLNIYYNLVEPHNSPSSISSNNLLTIPYYLNMGRENIAQKIYDQYGGIGSDKDEDLSKGWLYLYDGKYIEAHQFIDNIIMKFTNEGDLFYLGGPYFLKGMIYLRSKDYQNAIATLEKALTYHPHYPHYYSMFAAVDSDIYLLISQASLQLQDKISAREWIEKAYRLNSFEPRIQYQMALIEHDVGNHEKAKEYLKYCLDIWKYANTDFAPSMEAKQKWAEWNQVN